MKAVIGLIALALAACFTIAGIYGLLFDKRIGYFKEFIRRRPKKKE